MPFEDLAENDEIERASNQNGMRNELWETCLVNTMLVMYSCVN